MSNNHAKKPIVYVRRRRTQQIKDVVANVVASATQQEFSSKEIGQTSPKAQQRTEPNKLLENKEAKTIKKGRTNYCSNSSKLNTRQSKGGSAGNAKVISDDKEEIHKTWKPQTQEETHLNQLALVYDGNIDYVNSQLDFGKDLGEAAQSLAHTRICSLNKSLNDSISSSTYNAKRKGKEIYQERNNNMDFSDFYAQRRNKGITICERSMNSRSEEMTKLLGTSNNHSSGHILQFHDMNQVSPNYFLNNSMKEMSVWPRYHTPRTIVHPSKIIGSSRFSQYYDQYMQRTSVSAPINFSLMKLLMGDETLTDEELIYPKELLSTEDLSSGGQRVQQWPCSQVGNYQDMQRTSGSATWNFSFMKLLMEDEDSSILTEELNEKQFLSTQLSLSSEGQRVQQWPCSQVGNYQFENSVQQINLQSCQYQVSKQPQQIPYMDLLARDDNISYMDLLTREDISWT